MGYYESEWNERKSFLFKSMLIGAILAIALTILLGIFAFKSEEVYTAGTVVQMILTLIAVAFVGFLYLSAIVAVMRMVMSKSSVGGGIVTNFIRGFWLTVIGMFTGGWIGIVIGFLLMIVFIYLFVFVAFGYAIYLPISSIYLYIRYKREKA